MIEFKVQVTYKKEFSNTPEKNIEYIVAENYDEAADMIIDSYADFRLKVTCFRLIKARRIT